MSTPDLRYRSQHISPCVYLCFTEASDIFLVSRNFSLLILFLLSDEGLICFFLASRAGSFILVSRMKEKEVPSVSEKLKDLSMIGQCLAKFQALGGPGGCFSIYSEEDKNEM